MFANVKLVSLLLFAAAAQAAVNLPTPSLPTSLPTFSTTTTGPASPSSSSKIPTCVISCAGSAITSSGSKCASISDPCVCNDAKFQADMSACLKSKCNTIESAAATALQKGLCSNSSSTTTTSNSSGTASGSGSGSSSTKNVGVPVEFGQTGFFAFGVAVAGAVVGGLLL